MTGVSVELPGISKERFSTQTWKVTVSPTSIIAGSHALSAQGEMTALNEALHMEVPNSRRLMGAALTPISPRKKVMTQWATLLFIITCASRSWGTRTMRLWENESLNENVANVLQVLEFHKITLLRPTDEHATRL